MWLHIVIFVILLLLTVCSTLGWIHVENIGTAKGRKMFLVVALAGNITGGLLTWTKGGGQVFEDGYELKKEENAYEEKFMVSVEGEETGSVYVQIPEKELEKELQVLKVQHQGSLLMITARGTRSEIMEKIQAKNPLFMEVLPLTLEEIFISETEVAGYEIKNLF